MRKGNAVILKKGGGAVTCFFNAHFFRTFFKVKHTHISFTCMHKKSSEECCRGGGGGREGVSYMYAHIVQTVEAVSVHLHMRAQEK